MIIAYSKIFLFNNSFAYRNKGNEAVDKIVKDVELFRGLKTSFFEVVL